jgi:hypothetical protein
MPLPASAVVSDARNGVAPSPKWTGYYVSVTAMAASLWPLL